MSSSLRSHGTIDKTTKFQCIKTQAYYDNAVGRTVPIPFKYNNGVLDINIQDNVIVDLVEDEDTGSDENYVQVKTLGGSGLVTSLGPTMIRWLNNWVVDLESADPDTFSVYTPGIMTKIQVPLNPSNVRGSVLGNDLSDSAYGISSQAPTGDDYISGSQGNNYRTLWIFKTPVTIRYYSGSTPYYLTYNSTYSPTYD